MQYSSAIKLTTFCVLDHYLIFLRFYYGASLAIELITFFMQNIVNTYLMFEVDGQNFHLIVFLYIGSWNELWITP